jgi:hypothetical protein
MKNKLIDIYINVLSEYSGNLNFNNDQYYKLSDAKIKEVLSKSGFNDFVDIVKDIYDPSQELQDFIMDKWNGKCFPYINSPSHETVVKAIEDNPDNFLSLVNPPEDLSILYIKGDRTEEGIRNVHVLTKLSFMPSPKLQLEMVRNNPDIIEVFFELDKNYSPKEVVLLAVLNKTQGKIFPKLLELMKDIPEFIVGVAISLDPENKFIEGSDEWEHI